MVLESKTRMCRPTHYQEVTSFCNLKAGVLFVGDSAAVNTAAFWNRKLLYLLIVVIRHVLISQARPQIALSEKNSEKSIYYLVVFCNVCL